MTSFEVDLRSDTLSPSTPAMFHAMAGARIGMASTGEDENVNRLEHVGAALLGTEACAFLPNVTSANLLALLAQARRGTGVLMDRMSHVNQVEWYGITAFGGTVPWPVEADRGSLQPAALDAAFRDRNGGRRPVITALVLENTHNFAGGVPISVEETRSLAEVAHRHGAAVHLDGARLPNAAAALGVPMRDLVEGLDTVALSLTKALAAPLGALLAGRSEPVEAARSLGHHLGFTRIHRAGHFAAAGLVAVETMLDRLPEDHRRARLLAEGLASVDGLRVDLRTVRTNIVNARLEDRLGDAWAFAARLAARGVGFLPLSEGRLRGVLHRGIDDEDVARAVDAVAATVASSEPRDHNANR
jgi:threonine aldolase